MAHLKHEEMLDFVRYWASTNNLNVQNAQYIRKTTPKRKGRHVLQMGGAIFDLYLDDKPCILIEAANLCSADAMTLGQGITAAQSKIALTQIIREMAIEAAEERLAYYREINKDNVAKANAAYRKKLEEMKK